MDNPFVRKTPEALMADQKVLEGVCQDMTKDILHQGIMGIVALCKYVDKDKAVVIDDLDDYHNKNPNSQLAIMPTYSMYGSPVALAALISNILQESPEISNMVADNMVAFGKQRVLQAMQDQDPFRKMH